MHRDVKYSEVFSKIIRKLFLKNGSWIKTDKNTFNKNHMYLKPQTEVYHAEVLYADLLFTFYLFNIKKTETASSYLYNYLAQKLLINA